MPYHEPEELVVRLAHEVLEKRLLQLSTSGVSDLPNLFGYWDHLASPLSAIILLTRSA
jgi:hypothetical protein